MATHINNSKVTINGKTKIEESTRCYLYQIQNTGGLGPDSFQYTNCAGNITLTDLINPNDVAFICVLNGTIEVGTGFPFTVIALNTACG